MGWSAWWQVIAELWRPLLSLLVSSSPLIAILGRQLQPSQPDDHQILVEPACGVALVPFYDTTIIPRAMPVGGRKNIVVIVCGGSAVSLDKVATWMEDLPGESKEVEIEQFGGPRRLSVV